MHTRIMKFVKSVLNCRIKIVLWYCMYVYMYQKSFIKTESVFSNPNSCICCSYIREIVPVIIIKIGLFVISYAVQLVYL